MRRILLALSAVPVALALVAGGSAAQGRSPGWIGISFDVSPDRLGGATEVVVTQVIAESPAEAAGLRVGDRLLAVNDLDRPSELRELAERLRLREGDQVRMLVERDGRRSEIRLRAAERPRDFVVARRLGATFETDSLVETMMRAMDSLRIQIVQEGNRRIRITTGSPAAADGSDATVVHADGGRTVRAPFEFFVFQGEDHDSLRREMDELNAVIVELERELVEREASRRVRVDEVQLRGRIQPEPDAEVTRLERAMEEADRQSAALRAAMAEAARATAGFRYAVPEAPEPDESIVRRLDATEFRPLTPYLLGRNRVAGAEVIDLRPELASYFRVGAGVLVVDVAPRTPAAISGIVPGDVIVRIDQVAVRTVDDLRFGISQAEDTLPLTLVRQGSSIQVLLRR